MRVPQEFQIAPTVMYEPGQRVRVYSRVPLTGEYASVRGIGWRWRFGEVLGLIEGSMHMLALRQAPVHTPMSAEKRLALHEQQQQRQQRQPQQQWPQRPQQWPQRPQQRCAHVLAELVHW